MPGGFCYNRSMSSSQSSSLLERIQASSEKDRACIAALLTGWFGALADPLFVEKHRVSKTDFTRVRQLTFLRVFLFCLISFARSSVREALELIFSKGQSLLKVAPVTPSALCQALQKIGHSAFTDANTILVSRFRKTDLPRTWHGFRVTAIDGSNLNLPRFKALMEAFVPGVDPSLPGATAARLSLLLDVTNGLVLDARVGSCQTGEREYAFKHLEALGEGDIVLGDRGYPSLEYFAKIRERGAHFAIRMPGHWKAVKQFRRSGEKEAIVTLPSRKDPSFTMTVRLLKIEHEGKSMVVATSLLDATLFPLELFSELYHMRWWNEEWYKELKGVLALESVSGRSEEAFRRELHARILTQNLISLFSLPSLRALQKDAETHPPKGRTVRYKPNRAATADSLRTALALLFDSLRSLSALLSWILRKTLPARSAVRPGRAFPRIRAA